MNSKSNNPIQVTGKHILTQEEKDIKLSELLSAIQRKEELDAEKKQVMSGYKNKLDEQESNIKVISNLLNMGFEHRPYSCYLVKNFDSGKREYYEIGSERLIQVEPLNASDYQLQMETEEKAIAENNKAADQLQLVIDEKVEEAGVKPPEGIEPIQEGGIEASEPHGSLVPDDEEFDFGDDDEIDDNPF